MAHYSDLVSIRDGVVKNTTDLWILRGGQLVPVQSAWVVKNGALVKQFERVGVPVTMEFISPSPAANTGIVPGATVTWKVRVPTVDGLVPTGTVTFSGPGANTLVTLDAAGEASASFVYRPGDSSVSVTLASTNGYTAPTLSRIVNVNDTKVTINFVSPAYDTPYYGESNVTYRVRMSGAADRLPTGTVRFYGPNNQVKDGTIWHGQEGGVWYAYAEQTLWMPYSQRYVTAQLNANNDFYADNNSWRVRVLRNTQVYSHQYLWYESGKNYAGPNANGSWATTQLISGDLSGTSWRAFTRQNMPAKPNAGAFCVAAWVRFIAGSSAAAVRLGWHSWTTLPNTGSFTQGGINQNLVTTGGVTAGGEYWIDMGLHLAGCMNDGSFRGLVFGGPAGSTPYVWTNSAYVDVTWSWWEWQDT